MSDSALTSPAGAAPQAAAAANQTRGPRNFAPQSGFAPWNDPKQAPIVRFENVTKRFGDFVAVKDCNLEIYEREFFALLGPSGCGKSTLLRMLAGFERPTAGRIFVGGQDITELPPYERPVNMMFQSYALFPHMTVARNIGFGLRQEGLDAATIDARVKEAMDMVELGQFAARKPHQLSGGQQQRVALARALAKKPRIVLLDEPLGALDKRLRQQAQFELMRIQEETGTTFIIVTHDQEEAMTVASRIAVMDKGVFVQIATPGDIYEQPQSRYVANFIGDVNIVEAKVTSSANGVIKLAPTAGAYTFEIRSTEIVKPGQQVWLALRPEKLRICKGAPSANVNVLTGTVHDVGYLGSISHYHVKVESGERVTALRANTGTSAEQAITWEDKVYLEWPEDAGIVLTA